MLLHSNADTHLKTIGSMIVLPTFQESMGTNDREIVQIFLQSFRDLNYERGEVKILSAIHKTADVSGNSDALVAKTLVDYGLYAPRLSFPQDFLEHIEGSSLRAENGGFSALSKAYRRLIDFWTEIGEDRFAYDRDRYARPSSSSFLVN